MIDSHRRTKRRAAFTKELTSPFILSAHTSMQAKADMAAPFVQDASFFYLTGLTEPDWQVLFDTKQWHLVRPDTSEVAALFDGSLASTDATAISGITSILTSAQATEAIESLAKDFHEVSTIGPDPYEKHYDFVLNPAQQKLRKKLAKQFKQVNDCRSTLQRLRALKGKQELATQQAAIDLTVASFETVKKNLATFTHEYEIEAEFNAAFRRTGAGGHAYTPIVASGAHACTLHYIKNDSALPKNGLVLIDIGAQVQGYAADITRTYAVGTPSVREVAVHAAVEVAHHAIIDLIRPGLSFKEYAARVDDIMKEALKSLGLLTKPADYRTYFPHAISHGLGIDVHESLGGFATFMPGMVLTVEPGIYIPEEGIGVRIEDNIVVTQDGARNLSGQLDTSL